MRLDLWLWAVRAYKTRGLAADAIKAGRVEINQLPTKPAHTVRPDEIITLRLSNDFASWTRTLRVLAAPVSRVGAKLVPQYMEDLTSPQELEKCRARPDETFAYRLRGTGRPTKRERRELDDLFGA